MIQLVNYPSNYFKVLRFNVCAKKKKKKTCTHKKYHVKAVHFEPRPFAMIL